MLVYLFQTMLDTGSKNKDMPMYHGDKSFKCTYEDCGRLYTTTHHHLKVSFIFFKEIYIYLFEILNYGGYLNE